MILNDYVTLKTGVMAAKIQLRNIENCKYKYKYIYIYIYI